MAGVILYGILAAWLGKLWWDVATVQGEFHAFRRKLHDAILVTLLIGAMFFVGYAARTLGVNLGEDAPEDMSPI